MEHLQGYMIHFDIGYDLICLSMKERQNMKGKSLVLKITPVGMTIVEIEQVKEVTYAYTTYNTPLPKTVV